MGFHAEVLGVEEVEAEDGVEGAPFFARAAVLGGGEGVLSGFGLVAVVEKVEDVDEGGGEEGFGEEEEDGEVGGEHGEEG